jgi:hypothetical protein
MKNGSSLRSIFRIAVSSSLPGYDTPASSSLQSGKYPRKSEPLFMWVDYKAAVQNAANWSYYGTNASFFNPKTGVMAAIHVALTTAVSVGGKTNCADAGVTATAMDYMWCKKQVSIATGTTGYTLGFQARAANWASHANNTNPNIAESDEWAIGGFTLLAENTYANSDTLKTHLSHTTEALRMVLLC